MRAELERCRDRIRYVQSQVDEHAATNDASSEASARTLRKLVADLLRARDDANRLQKELDDLMD
jgi:hypothetical protein